MPPQEQGSFGVKTTMYPMYKVKMIIRHKEEYRPIRLVRGIKRHRTMASSREGIPHTTMSVKGEIRGDLDTAHLNFSG
jgi:hypothetical protein